MIEKYGADAVRWFILSDSPPEKDIQWSDTGVAAANKFLQKIWNLSFQIINRKDKKISKKFENKFLIELELLFSKIDRSIEAFKFNVTIAHFYETYNLFNYYLNLEISNKCLINSITKLMKLLLPITPHIANEILDLLKCNSKNTWPIIKRDIIEEIKFAVQINGKTRDIITIKKNLIQNQIEQIIKEKSKANKFLENKKIFKTIFVQNRIINYIIE